MGILKIIRHTNDGLIYMENALNYILTEREDCVSLSSYNTDINNAYKQYYAVKDYYGKTSGNPLFHFIVSYNTRTTWGDNPDMAVSLSNGIANYFTDRYQIVWCVHKKLRYENGKCKSIYHAHFIMNSVSYVDGKMFSGNHSDIYDFLKHIKRITDDKSFTMIYGSDVNSEDVQV